MRNSQPLSAENYQYQLDEQRRIRIRQIMEQEKLARLSRPNRYRSLDYRSTLTRHMGRLKAEMVGIWQMSRKLGRGLSRKVYSLVSHLTCL